MSEEGTQPQKQSPEVTEFLANPERFSFERLMAMDVDTFVALRKLCKDNPILSIAMTKALGKRNLKDDYTKEGRKQNQPYYSETYANALKPSLDEMLRSGESIELPYSAAAKQGWSHTTLRNMVHQAFTFICDKLDPSGVYKKLRMESKITCELPHALQIVYRKLETTPILEFRVARTSTNYDELTEYVAKAIREMKPGTKVLLPNDYVLPFTLTPEQIVELENLSSGSIIVIASDSNVQIMKRDE